MLKKQIIYIFPYSLTAWDATRYGFDFMLAQGVELKVFDLSMLVSSRSDTGRKFLHTNYIKKISSYLELETVVRQAANTAIFIDCINGLAGLRWQSRHIFRLFKKYNIQYFIVEIGSLPLQVTINRKQIINKLKKALQIKKLFVFLQWKLGKSIVDWRARYFHHYQLPAKIFVGHTELLQSYLNRYNLTKDRIIPIHSFDYDRYLNYQNTQKHIIPDEGQVKLDEEQVLPNNDKGICVFLDQALIQHSDFGKSIGFCPVTAQKYFPSINKFFDKLEKLTGLNIVIAVNPRTQYDKTPQIFGGRPLIKDKTLELVAQSSLVLVHNSTAVNFAVLFNKPILFLKTSEMLNAYGFTNLIDNMASALETKTVCIDHDDDVENAGLQDYTNWERNFSNYKYKYVMTKDLKNKTTWEIVLDELCERCQ